MYPAITFKSIFTSSLWSKDKMVITVLINYLCIDNPVIIIGIAIITCGTHKLFIHYRNKIAIHTYILIHVTKVLRHTFIFNSVLIHCLYYFSSAQWFRLVII